MCLRKHSEIINNASWHLLMFYHLLWVTSLSCQDSVGIVLPSRLIRFSRHISDAICFPLPVSGHHRPQAEVHRLPHRHLCLGPSGGRNHRPRPWGQVSRQKPGLSCPQARSSYFIRDSSDPRLSKYNDCRLDCQDGTNLQMIITHALSGIIWI